MVEIALTVFGLFGILFGLFCGWKLRAWESSLSRAHIMLSRKHRVHAQFSLLELANWTRQLNRYQRTNGKAIYSSGGVVLSIMRPSTKPKVKTRTVKSR